MLYKDILAFKPHQIKQVIPWKQVLTADIVVCIRQETAFQKPSQFPTHFLKDYFVTGLTSTNKGRAKPVSCFSTQVFTIFHYV